MTDTQLDSYDDMLPAFPTLNARVKWEIKRRGPLCCFELELITGWTHQTTSGRLTDLGPKHQGWLYDTGIRRKNTKDKRGQMQIAWGLLEKPKPKSQKTNKEIIRELELEVAKLKTENAQLKRLLYGPKSRPKRTPVPQLEMFDR